MSSVASCIVFANILFFTTQSRIGLVIPNNFEAYQLICPEGSPYPCAATDGEFTQTNQFDLANHRFYEGSIGCTNAKIAITTSGLGTINAALTAQLLIDHYRQSKDPIDMILTYGIAGGIDDRLAIGDVLVASKWSVYNLWVWQDEDDSPDDELPLEQFGAYDRTLGYWETTEFGRVWFQKQELFLEPEVRTRVEYFNVSQDALEIMKNVETEIESKLLTCVPDDPDNCLPNAPQLYTSIDGEDVIGLTASIFVDSSSWRQQLFKRYGAQSVDMETGSVAMVAATNEIPFLAFRSLSNLAGGEDETNSIDTFFALAVENSITVLTSWIDAAYCQEPRRNERGSKRPIEVQCTKYTPPQWFESQGSYTYYNVGEETEVRIQSCGEDKISFTGTKEVCGSDGEMAQVEVTDECKPNYQCLTVDELRLADASFKAICWENSMKAQGAASNIAPFMDNDPMSEYIIWNVMVSAVSTLCVIAVGFTVYYCVNKSYQGKPQIVWQRVGVTDDENI